VAGIATIAFVSVISVLYALSLLMPNGVPFVCETSQDCKDEYLGCHWECVSGECVPVYVIQMIPCEGAVWNDYPECRWVGC